VKSGTCHLKFIIDEFIKANPDPKKCRVSDLFRLGFNSPGEFDRDMRQAYKTAIDKKRPLNLVAMKDLAELRLAIMKSTLESQEYLKKKDENQTAEA
jgi:hypothetical protein